jgi:hypothetical protein
MLSVPDPRGIPNEQRLIADTAKIVAFVEESTGLRSRWSGEIQISQELDDLGEPLFLGRKLPGCPIEYHQSVLGDIEMYYVGLEEALHSCSVIYPTAGQNLRHLRRWEEATVGSCFELLKPRFRALFSDDHVSVVLLSNTTTPLSYEQEMKALGALRRLTDWGREDFYFALLRTPLTKRRDTILSRIAHDQDNTIEAMMRDDTVSECISILDKEV